MKNKKKIMKQLILLSTDTDWSLQVKWLFSNAYWLIPTLLAVFIILIIWNRILVKKSQKQKYEFIKCEGITNGLGLNSYRKNVIVRKHKEENTFEFKDLDGDWYPLRPYHVKQIFEDSKELEIPRFTIPKRKTHREKAHRINIIKEKDKMSLIQTAST